MEKKSSLGTLLFALALLLFLSATFAMFGKIVSHEGSAELPNMFQAAFGTSAGALGYRLTGLTAIFIFQMIIVVCVLAIIIGTITRKFHYIFTIVLYGIVCLCAFIALIISFNAKTFYCDARDPGFTGDYSLGAGPIAYSVLHIIGLVASAAGLVFSRRG